MRRQIPFGSEEDIHADSIIQQHNVFMRVDVMSIVDQRYTTQTNVKQDPLVQKATGKTDPVEVMSKLREMKNSFK